MTMDVLNTAAQSYLTAFSGYVGQFTKWGQWLFFGLLTINVIWLALWAAFDKNSISESMPGFLKELFVCAFFYTLMLNPGWLGSALETVKVMGSTIAHAPIDPSSLIDEGMGLANSVIKPIADSSILTAPLFGLIVITIVYLVIIFTFLSIALELTLTLIITTALITLSTFFLSFAALGATLPIARNTLDVVIGNCVKMLGIYVVVAAGTSTIAGLAAAIPTSLASFDPYVEIVAVTVLFWLLAKNLPAQLGRIVSIAMHENRGTDAAALAISAVSIAKTLMPAAKLAGAAAGGLAKLAGSGMNNTAANFAKARAEGSGVAAGAAAAVGGAMGGFGRAVGGAVADHFRHAASKLAGGPGIKEKTAEGKDKPVAGVAERMHKAATAARAAASKAGDEKAAGGATSQPPKGKAAPFSKPK
jgi:P-type conjugative transfer protein TrbL